MIDKYLEFIDKRKANNIYRQNKQKIATKIDLTTNDYLGLSRHPEMIKTAQEYAIKYGVGAGSSRLLLNNNDIYKDLEDKIANWKGTKKAMFFSSGYQLNSSVIPSLLCEKTLDSKPIVFADKLNHSSINNGVLLSGSKQVRYSNCDLDMLEFWLKKYDSVVEKFIITESIFGMDGTIVDIHRLVNLAKKYKAFLYIDEAHSTGVYGKNGNGLCGEFSGEIDCIIGTFSKGMGCQGGYIAVNNIIYDYLFNHCSGFVYSTAPSPILVGLANKSIDLVSKMDTERISLIENCQKFKQQFKKYQLTGDEKSHIFSIILGTPQKCDDFAKQMIKNDILVSAIKYPTVPKNTDRIRIAINSSFVFN